MTRLDLTARLGRELGLKPTDTAQKAVLVELLNDAANEVYTQTDLPRTLMEEQFIIDTTDPLPRVTLPGRVGEIRAVRDFYGQIKLHDMRPRYHTLPWPNDSLYTFRILTERPIMRSIDNAIGLYMEPLVAFQGDLEISIVGKTADAEEVHASFDSTGAGSAVGVLFEDIYAINKNLDTPTDIILRSGNSTGDEMARIGAMATSSLYIEIEMQERPQQCCTPVIQQYRCLDVLYKPPFRPLSRDTSVFQVAGYDHVLIYKAVEIYRLRGIGSGATQEQILAATAHAKRSDEVLANSIQDKIQGEELVINWGKPRGDIRNLRGLRARRYGTSYNSGWAR